MATFVKLTGSDGDSLHLNSDFVQGIGSFSSSAYGTTDDEG